MQALSSSELMLIGLALAGTSWILLQLHGKVVANSELLIISSAQCAIKSREIIELIAPGVGSRLMTSEEKGVVSTWAYHTKEKAIIFQQETQLGSTKLADVTAAAHEAVHAAIDRYSDDFKGRLIQWLLRFREICLEGDFLVVLSSIIMGVAILSGKLWLLALSIPFFIALATELGLELACSLKALRFLKKEWGASENVMFAKKILRLGFASHLLSWMPFIVAYIAIPFALWGYIRTWMELLNI